MLKSSVNTSGNRIGTRYPSEEIRLDRVANDLELRLLLGIDEDELARFVTSEIRIFEIR